MTSEQTKIRTDFLNTNTTAVSHTQTYTTSRKMKRISMNKLVERTRLAVERDKAHGRKVIAKLALN